MKVLFNLKILLMTVFVFNFQFIIINQQSSNLYAQDTELFNHTWYFVNGELNGNEFLPTQNLTPELNFFNDFIGVNYPFCSGGITFEEVIYDSISFEIMGDHYVLVDECFYPNHEDELLLMQLHDFFYGDFQNTGTVNTPFAYIIEAVDDYLQLTITNSEEGWAVYNSRLLSAQDFNSDSFRLYPNPSEEILNIKNLNNLMNDIAICIFDINGKLMKTEIIEEVNSNISLNISHLKRGVYFLTIENKEGHKQSSKFVKQ